MTANLRFDRVHIIGTGLLGTSLGMALSERGATVTLEDLSPARAALASEYGAGEANSDAQPELVIVATPPDVTASVVQGALSRFPDAAVIDVSSVKNGIASQMSETDDAGRFLATHPMAGREKGGPTHARSDLFTGRPWVICPTDTTPQELISSVSTLIGQLGASVHQMTAAAHDEAVAVVSHLPQLVSSALAASLEDADSEALELAGQGLRDVTRIAAADPELWSQILHHNAPAVRAKLADLRERLESVDQALFQAIAHGSQRGLAEAIQAGATGVSLLPGKHGRSDRFTTLTVVIDDRPGQLAALLTDIGALGVNLEDMSLEHSPGAPVGFVALSVVPAAAEQLVADLGQRGWRVAEDGA